VRRVAKMTWLEFKLFARDPLTLIFTVAVPLIVLFIMGQVFGNTPDPEGVVYRGHGAMDFHIPAYIALAVASLGLIGLPAHLAAYRERGVLRRFRASSISLRAVLGSQAAVMTGMAVGSAILLVAAAVVRYSPHAPVSPGLVLPGFILGTLCFASVAVLLGSLIPTARGAQGVGVLLWFVMMMLSGSGPPPEVIGDVLGWVAKFMPLTHTIRLMQDPWLGDGWNWTETIIVAGITIGAALISLRFFRWESRKR